MRTMTGPRPVRFRKIKSLALTALLLTVAFLAGAVAERTNPFLQDAAALVPVVLEEIRDFFREQVFFKVNAAAEQLKWATVIALLIITESPGSLIRGP